jgi:pimeloyl-ACP methyl ester carboxylesterase
MPEFDSAGVRIHYEVFGAGRPLVLVHGFVASLRANWVATGWTDVLSPVRQLIALDCRGHGESDRPHDPAAYAAHEMTDDVVRLMDHLGVATADIFGYSMGAGITLRALVRHPQRFTSAVLGGIGDVQRRGGRRPGVAEALLTDDPSSISDPVAKAFRLFAEGLKSDRQALAALQQAERPPLEDAQLAAIVAPVLIVNGANDTLAGSAHEMASAIPGARLVELPEKDHLTTVADAGFKQLVLDFLREPARVR